MDVNNNRPLVIQGVQIVKIFAHWVIIFLWAVFSKLQKKPKYLVCLFPRKKLCIEFDEKWVELHFGKCFHKPIWSPCLAFTTLEECWHLHSYFSSKFFFYGDQWGRSSYFWPLDSSSYTWNLDNHPPTLSLELLSLSTYLGSTQQPIPQVPRLTDAGYFCHL
jgi:hypothetical protein